MSKIKDLTNKTFDSGITALEFVEIKNHAAYWKCKCHCGNIFITRGADLTNGHTKSCGCIGRERIKQLGKQTNSKIDLTGQRFGKLTVLEDTGKRDSCRSVIWKCQCDCGNFCEVTSHKLRQGHTQSCGCLISKGELKINQILHKEEIKFISQFSFENCIFEDTNRQAKFDFYLPEQNILIEYDGIQHLDMRYGWNTDKIFSKTFEHDLIKNQYCLNNNIQLYRIPYTDYDNINSLKDILQDKYLVKQINHYNL